MPLAPPRRPRRAHLAAAGVAALTLLATGLNGTSAIADQAPQQSAQPSPVAPKASTGRTGGSGEVAANYDVRSGSSPALLRGTARAITENGGAMNKLGKRIGGDARVSVDAATGTPSNVSSRLGFLTAPSSRPAADVALGFVRDNLSAFGLSKADLGTLSKSRQVTDINGITHVFWVQKVDGVPVFGNGLRAHIDRRGQLISVQGAPVAGLAAMAAKAPDARLDAGAAKGAAVRDARGTSAKARPGGTAQRVWFMTPGGLRAGWSTYTHPGAQEGYQHVIDAATGRTLYRHSTVNFENDRKKPKRRGDALVFDNYPGATGPQTGGKQRIVNFVKRGWIARGAKKLHGKYAYVFADLNDDNKAQPNEQDPAPRATKPRFKFIKFKTAKGQQKCTSAYQCTYNPNIKFSWRKNKAQDGVQAFFFTSQYAGWLSRAPFGFTQSLGNFTRARGDEVLVNTMDGANTANGLPDDSHINNANFDTPPDGQKPTMQMYLNKSPYLGASSSNPFDNIGHEFTHGLSNRLVVDSQGNSTLNSYQAGAMGEAWGDFYSMDYLFANKFIKKDTKKPGELMYDRYLSKDRAYTRTEAIDCPRDKGARLCKQVDGKGVGGYTYGDIPRMLTTEVHSAGEVWAQTMWDLHTKLGHQVTMRLVTSAMTLSPNDPSMLDMRDAILTADKAIYGKSHTAVIWRTFAHRGFGYFAASIDGNDAEPAEDFHIPPPAGAQPGSITGTVKDPAGEPIAGAVVTVAGHSSGVAGNYSAISRANGTYTINGVVPGRYPKVAALADGYELQDSVPVTVTSGAAATADFTIRRDYAAAGGGGSIASFTGVDYSDFGCGPGGAIDLSSGTGWGSTTTSSGDPATSEADVDPESIVIKLPEAVDIQAFGVNPSATCGDGASASTAGYTIEVGTSATGTWTEAASGEFTADDVGTKVEIPTDSTLSGITFVRYTMNGPQVPDFSVCPDGADGCSYMDTTEVAVYADTAAGPVLN